MGLRHYELYFVDGSTPPEDVVQEFLRIVEREPGGIAIHCKAGLGRTGTLIGIYAMKYFKFPAAPFIGWIRLCRPGSVLGPQQQYLCDREKEFISNNDSRSQRQVNSAMSKLEISPGMSPEDRFISEHGDHGQAERLISAKKSNQSSPNSPLLTEKDRAPQRGSPNRNLSQGPISPGKKFKSTYIQSEIKPRPKTPSSLRSPVKNIKQ